jgi:hypothetical protein
MYIFGGILELTKELNEMLCYNFESKSFQCLSKDAGTEAADADLGATNEESPGAKRNTIKLDKQGTLNQSSPTKTGKFSSPTKTGGKLNLTAKARKAGKSPKKGNEKEEKESGLASPTSISM